MVPQGPAVTTVRRDGIEGLGAEGLCVLREGPELRQQARCVAGEAVALAAQSANTVMVRDKNPVIAQAQAPDSVVENRGLLLEPPRFVHQQVKPHVR